MVSVCSPASEMTAEVYERVTDVTSLGDESGGPRGANGRDRTGYRRNAVSSGSGSAPTQAATSATDFVSKTK